MRKGWRLPTKCLVKSNVLGSRNEPFLQPISTHSSHRRTWMFTSPLMTCVIFIKWSSTTFARWYVGKPSVFMRIKSSSGSFF